MMKFPSSYHALRYLLSLTPGTLTIAGNLAGGWWTISNTIYTMFLLIGIEQIFKENKKVNDVTNGVVPNMILSLHIVIHTAAVATMIYGIQVGTLTGKFIWLASLSTGISAGIE